MPPDTTDESVAITTYIPEHQKGIWETHADELEMSLSEFVRSMVQAGRRGFRETEPHSTQSAAENPGENMEQTVLQALDEKDALAWEDLVDFVQGDLESTLEEAVISLQEADEITHRPRDGTYTRTE